VNLKAKQGRNQKGFCFVSDEESDVERGVYELGFKGKTVLADIRKSPRIPKGLAILDNRLFSYLGCDDSADVTLARSSFEIPVCKEIELLVLSTKKLDNKSIAEAISKRVSDLQDDFEGLILQKNQRIALEHLGIQLTVRSINPLNDSCQSCRVIWNHLEKMHLVPVVGVPAYNIICVIELGAAAHISDVLQISTAGESMPVPRYQAALEAINQIMLAYSGYGTNSHFSGFIYSNEVVAFSVFDSQRGTPVDISLLYSISLLESFREWVQKEIPLHKNKPSNPGQALSIALNRGSSFPESHEHPTVILLFSSGVHSHGPNPVKVVRKSKTSPEIPIICVALGTGSNQDVLEEIAATTKGVVIKINSIKDVANINDIIAQYFVNRS